MPGFLRRILGHFRLFHKAGHGHSHGTRKHQRGVVTDASVLLSSPRRLAITSGADHPPPSAAALAMETKTEMATGTETETRTGTGTGMETEPCHGRKQGGFGIRVTVPANKGKSPPLVYQCTPGSGGVQGLKWYVERLQMDEDGDIAQEFLDEVTPQSIGPSSVRKLPSRLVVKMHTRPIKAKGPLKAVNGNLHQSAEI